MKSMQEQEHTTGSGNGNGNGHGMNIADELKKFEAEEAAKLGLSASGSDHWQEDATVRFTKQQRDTTTLMVSGLTMAQDLFLQSAMKGLGYNVIALDCPDNESLRVGKEFGNRGQCNPTYYTVGNLVRHLQHLRDEKGIPAKKIIEDYIFVTAGGCGPCRFSMYITEYRKALRDSGFDGFRVLTASQTGGANQAIGEGMGLEVTPRFFLGVMLSFVLGDILNALMYRIRPYEVEEGATDKAVLESRAIIMKALSERTSILRAMWKVRKVMGAVRVDRTMLRPRVGIIGEFWAMTTEGDGNYRLQRFLESEGAEVDIQLMINWLLYLNWEIRYDIRQRAGLKNQDNKGKGLKGMNWRLVRFGTWAVDKAARGIFYAMGRLMGLRGYKIPDMDDLAKTANQYYNNELRGGEGHMEVGKLIKNVRENKTNMTVSVKPFGCMPSSGVSDGIQSLITERYPQAIFLAIETSGDGKVNVQSRIQMQLFKARQVARQEVDQALASYGLTMEEVSRWLEKHPRYNHAFHRSPHRAGNATADLVHEVGRRMGRKPLPVESLAAESA